MNLNYLGSRPGADGAGPMAEGSRIESSDGWDSPGPAMLGSREEGSRPGADGPCSIASGSLALKSKIMLVKN